MWIFLDELFCLFIDSYHWDRKERILLSAGFRGRRGRGENVDSITRPTCGSARLWFQDAVETSKMTSEAAMARVIGQGHHRVMATKGG